MKKIAGFIIRIIFILCGFITRILFLPKVIYTDKTSKIAMKSGAILIANHQSHNDGFFVPHVLPLKKIHVLVTRKWYDKKYLNFAFSCLPYIPINLNEQDIQWIQQTEKLLKQGRNVLIFPEGKLERGERQPFQSGFLLPVRHLDVPVIPMAIIGEYRLFHRQKLIIGSPIKLNIHKKGRLSLILKESADICETTVFALYDKYSDKL